MCVYIIHVCTLSQQTVGGGDNLNKHVRYVGVLLP